MLNQPPVPEDHPQETPRLSIGLPVFNAQDNLETALDSLLAQTYTNFELILSDNGSDDRTAAICKEYMQRDSRIRYERQAKNMGLHWNLNRVAKMACGHYFKWSAADVIHAPDFLERCMAVLETDPTIICCHTRADYIDAQGNRLFGVDPSGDANLSTSSNAHRRFADVLFNHGWGARVFGVMRREPLLKTGLLEEHYGWDKVMMAGLALSGRYHMINEVLFLEQDHETIEAGRDWEVAGQAESDLPATHDREGKPFNRFAFIRGYLQMAWRFSPNWTTAMICSGWVCLYPLQIHKWRRLACAAIARSSVYTFIRQYYSRFFCGDGAKQSREAISNERA